MNRILPIERIPLELWRDAALRLPPSLCATYVAQLDELGLRHYSLEKGKKDIHGGQTPEETREHFATRFAASAGRTEFTVLGPAEAFAHLSDAFLSSFSDGTIAVLDVPCGTGAMTCALVSTLVTLRARQVVPRTPLTIQVCAGDFSDEALTIFALMARPLVEEASEQGITLTWETHRWDATRGDQTADLVDRWFSGAPAATEYFIVFSNFSGALAQTHAFESFAPCMEQIVSRVHNKQSTLTWIEPATKVAKETLFTKLLKQFSSRWLWFTRTSTIVPGGIAEAHYILKNPLSRSRFESNVVVHRFERK